MAGQIRTSLAGRLHSLKTGGHMIEIKEGDKIRTEGLGGAVHHYGIYVGRDPYYRPCVAHNNKGVGVQVTTFETFSNGKPVFIEEAAPDDPAVRSAIVKRALKLRGKRYNLLFFNCEDFANYAYSEIPYSKQVIGACLLGSGAIALGRAIASK